MTTQKNENDEGPDGPDLPARDGHTPRTDGQRWRPQRPTIAEATGNSRSSTHRILQSLAESGHAEKREAALLEDVESTRDLGQASSFEERVVGVDGVAAPLISSDTVGGPTVAIPTSHAPKDGPDAFGQAMRKRAHELSLALTAMGVKRI